MSEKKRGLPRPPFYASEYIDMAEILQFAYDRFGKLVLAIMRYTMDGTIPDDLPLDIKPMFAVYQKKIDYARTSYESACEKNRVNGKKGGRPRKDTTSTKAESGTPSQTELEPPEKSDTAPVVKMPPTKQQLTDLIKQGQADGRISAGCKPAEFFEWAETLKWKVNGEPAERVGDFLEYAVAKHPTEEVADKVPPEMRRRLGKVYGDIFKKFHGLRDTDGNTCALTAAIDFLSAYDGGWNIHGKTFSDDNWLDALAEFMKDLQNRTNPNAL